MRRSLTLLKASPYADDEAGVYGAPGPVPAAPQPWEAAAMAMSRINTNVTSLVAQRILNVQNDRLYTSLERLSTGLRINRGKDDPAGLIASETLRAEQRAIQAAITNVSRATNVVSVAESGLAEIAGLLNDLEELIDKSSNETGISDDERTANQNEIDFILESINRISNSVGMQGRKLLGGSLSYITSSVNSAEIARLQLNSVRIPDGGPRAVALDVTIAAEAGVVSYTSGALGSTPVTIEVTGNLGTERITFASASLADIVNAVNQSREMTGVSAYSAAGAVMFNSSSYGSEQYVRVRTLDGTFNVGGTGDVIDYGVDAVVNVNGSPITADGLLLRVRRTTLDADILLAEAYGNTVAGGTSQFGVTAGGAMFQINPTVDMNGQATLGIDAVNTTWLGDPNTGFLWTIGSGQTNELNSGHYTTQQKVVRAAILQVATLRGRLGSFERNTLAPTAASLEVQYENMAAAESLIRDADFAIETSNMTRQQILVQSGTMVLRLANQSPQSVLQLLS
jgi:flagellin